jgi:DNA-binding Lrp family transcriptional regulator
MDIESRILSLLHENGKISHEEIANRLNVSTQEVKEIISELEDNNVILGYHAIIDKNALNKHVVKALIQVSIRPERDGGFDRIAKRLSRFPQVNSLYLISGGFDLQIVVEGETLNEVASFVSSKLATIDGVVSTETHFLLKKYKESGQILYTGDEIERLKVTP